jgi:7-keto-8-aminopelargonate synthetase-like enzyme
MVEYPAFARGRARFRFQVMAMHTPEQIDTAAGIFRRSLAEAPLQLAE